MHTAQFKSQFQNIHQQWRASGQSKPILRQKPADSSETEILNLATPAKQMCQPLAAHYRLKGIQMIAIHHNGFADERIKSSDLEHMRHCVTAPSLTGVLMYDDFTNHVTPFILGFNRVISPIHNMAVPHDSILRDHGPEAYLKALFPGHYYTPETELKKPGTDFIFNPQASGKGCAMLAAKIIRQIIGGFSFGSIAIDDHGKKVMPHPMVFKHSQSDQFTRAYTSYFCSKTGAHAESIIAQYEHYQNTHMDKDRLGYCSAKHSTAEQRQVIIQEIAAQIS